MRYLLLLLSYGILACQQPVDVPLITEAPFPILIDTQHLAIHYFLRPKVKRAWRSTSSYSFLYIGPYKDTIAVNPVSRYDLAPPPPPPPGSDPINYPSNFHPKDPLEGYFTAYPYCESYPLAEDTALSIQIDTHLITNNHTYPVLLTNPTSDTIYVAYGRRLPLVLEAKDSLGFWKPIEERFVYGCGMGLRTVFLPPNYIILTEVPIDTGAFKTDLRLKLGDNYSKPFAGSIHYRQFESRFTEIGSDKASLNYYNE